MENGLDFSSTIQKIPIPGDYLKFFSLKTFIYLAVLGVRHAVQDLRCVEQDLDKDTDSVVRLLGSGAHRASGIAALACCSGHVGSSPPRTRDRTQVLYIASDSYPWATRKSC